MKTKIVAIVCLAMLAGACARSGSGDGLRIVPLEGDVVVVHGSAESLVTEPQELAVGDSIRTGPGGTAFVEFPGDLAVELAPSSELAIAGVDRSELADGQALFHAPDGMTVSSGPAEIEGVLPKRFPARSAEPELRSFPAAEGLVAAMVALQAARADGRSPLQVLRDVLHLRDLGAEWSIVVARWQLLRSGVLAALSRITDVVAGILVPAVGSVGSPSASTASGGVGGTNGVTNGGTAGGSSSSPPSSGGNGSQPPPSGGGDPDPG